MPTECLCTEWSEWANSRQCRTVNNSHHSVHRPIALENITYAHNSTQHTTTPSGVVAIALLAHRSAALRSVVRRRRRMRLRHASQRRQFCLGRGCYVKCETAASRRRRRRRDGRRRTGGRCVCESDVYSDRYVLRQSCEKRPACNSDAIAKQCGETVSPTDKTERGALKNWAHRIRTAQSLVCRDRDRSGEERVEGGSTGNHRTPPASSSASGRTWGNYIKNQVCYGMLCYAACR